ncbi:MAG: hypothetical protein WAX14_24200 [Rhodococcus sp. (in: high G+C Gram-positive bacteria)]
MTTPHPWGVFTAQAPRGTVEKPDSYRRTEESTVPPRTRGTSDQGL